MVTTTTKTIVEQKKYSYSIRFYFLIPKTSSFGCLELWKCLCEELKGYEIESLNTDI